MNETSIQKIGRYEIEREIGRGGMAVVYKARDTRLDRPVAIKLIQTDAFATNAFGSIRERFEREAKALARLDHPNIVKVYDYGEYESAPYLVMDYLDGATLKELKKPVRVDVAVKLLTPIADALDYVHRHGLLHRDIKPSNIMMTSENRIVLTDFGIVKWLEEDGDLHTLTATGVGIGTPEYMSPEQGRGKQVDARSDMYSLSIVFYELITGQKPFTGDTPVDILLRQISEPIPDPRHLVPEISPSVKKFLDRAAAKDPKDRYLTAKEYLLDFQGLRLQAQANRAMGQTSNSGFQSLPRKTETAASSLEIGKTDLAKVRAEAATDPRGVRMQTAPAKRISWGALTFGLVLIAVLIGGIFGLQNRGKNSVAETQSAAQAQILAATADRAMQIATGTAEREELIVKATFAAERTATQTAKYQVGNIIKFGRYEQDNDFFNGEEDIEWRILAREGDTALIVSVMGLDAKPYNDNHKEITWENCTLRRWLNNKFYNAAFSVAEQAVIELSHIVNEDNPTYSTKGGNDTEDNVFLLSISEAEQYFMDDDERFLKPTKYALANGAWTSDINGNAFWWLRSSGAYQSDAAGIYFEGDVLHSGAFVLKNDAAVRPALWINLGK